MEIKIIDKKLEEQFQILDELFKEAEIEKNNLKKAQNIYQEITENLKELENNYDIALKELENKTKDFNEFIEGGLKLIDSKLDKIKSDMDDLSGRLFILNENNIVLTNLLHSHIDYFNKSPLKRWMSRIKK